MMPTITTDAREMIGAGRRAVEQLESENAALADALMLALSYITRLENENTKLKHLASEAGAMLRERGRR